MLLFTQEKNGILILDCATQPQLFDKARVRSSDSFSFRYSPTFVGSVRYFFGFVCNSMFVKTKAVHSLQNLS